MRKLFLVSFILIGLVLNKAYSEEIKSIEINPQNLIPKVMEVASGRKKQVVVYGNNYNTKDGTGVRDYIHVSDLAKAHIDSINYIFNNKENLTKWLANPPEVKPGTFMPNLELSEKEIEALIAYLGTLK